MIIMQLGGQRGEQGILLFLLLHNNSRLNECFVTMFDVGQVHWESGAVFAWGAL